MAHLIGFACSKVSYVSVGLSVLSQGVFILSNAKQCLNICMQRKYNVYGEAISKSGSGLCTLYFSNKIAKCVSYLSRNFIKYSEYFTSFWHLPWKNYCFRTLVDQSSTEDTDKTFNFNKAASEQAAIKVRQKSQNVSLIPNDWQHTLSPRTRSGAGSNFYKILSKNVEIIHKLAN